MTTTPQVEGREVLLRPGIARQTSVLVLLDFKVLVRPSWEVLVLLGRV